MVPGSSAFSARLPSAVDAGRSQPPGAGLGVLGHLRQLADEPELRRLAQLALGDWPRIRLVKRHDPVRDRLPGRLAA